MHEDEPGRAPARAVAHEIGCDLAAVSLDELGQRIGLLEAEIERLRAEIERKRRSRDAAGAVFRV